MRDIIKPAQKKIQKKIVQTNIKNSPSIESSWDKSHMDIGSQVNRKNKNIWKYFLGFAAITIIAGSVFWYFNAFKKQNVSQFLTLKTGTEREIILNNKSSLYTPFVKNEGQINDKVKYYTSIFSGSLFVTDNSLTYLFQQDNQRLALAESFLDREGQNISIKPEGQNQSQTTTSYFQGKQDDWKTNIFTNDSIRLGELYNRIDVHLRAYGDNVEKLFVVEDGGNPNDITLKLEGADKLAVTDKGELELKVEDQKVLFTKPIAYQLVEDNNQSDKLIDKIKEKTKYFFNKEKKRSKKKYITTKYVLKSDNTYGFQVGNYDKSQPLIIDPLVSSTYIGGISDEHYGYDDFGGRIYSGHKPIARDSAGNIYIIGHTQSNDYPTTLGVVDDSYNDSSSSLPNDIIVSKFNSNLTQLLASTYLGGTSEDEGSAIIVDGSDVYITGLTRSNDFPTTSGTVDTTFNGGNSDTFIAKLNTDLTQLEASTYIGGNDKDFGYSLLKTGGGIYLVGDTYSSNFPTRPGAYDGTFSGNGDGFLMELTDDLVTINHTTFLGGSKEDFLRMVNFDHNGNIVAVGYTNSNDFPTTVGSYSQTFSGAADVFVSIISSDLNTLTASTFIGGTSIDKISSLVIDSSNNINIAGNTNSTDFPVSAYQTSNAGDYDGFVAKFNDNLTTLSASTYIGGSGHDDIYEIAIDNSDNIYIVGQTRSNNYPVTSHAYDQTLDGTSDASISRFTSDLSILEHSTYFGGSGNVDYILSAEHLNSGSLLMVGITDSNDLSTTVNAYDSTYNGGRDMFVTEITDDLTSATGPDHIVVRDNNDNSSGNFTAGTTQTIKIIVQDTSGNTVTSVNGNHVVRLEGASNGPHNDNVAHDMEPVCNGVIFGNDMTLTFTNGVATCDATLYAQEIASIDGEVDINTFTYDSKDNTSYDLDTAVNHNGISYPASSIEAQINPTVVTNNVTVTVFTNDAYGNILNSDGAGKNVTVNISGTNAQSLNATDNGDGTYTASYTSGSTEGEDQITATIDTNSVGWDEDGTADGTFHLPIVNQTADHMILRYENPVGTYNSSLSTTAGTAVTLAIMIVDQYDNPVDGYNGHHVVKITGANKSFYDNQSTCGTTRLGDWMNPTFTDGVAKCTLHLYKAENIELEGEGDEYSTSPSNNYDLDVIMNPANLHNLQIIGDDNYTAGVGKIVTISARDQYGNIRNDYSGSHNITFSGANISRNGTSPTVTDNGGSAINFGSATTLNFVNGEVSTVMTLYKREDVEIEVDDGSYNSTADERYDLNGYVNSTGSATASETTIEVSQDPAGTCGAEAVYVIARDTYGNQLKLGGNTVVLNITGANPNTPTIIDKGDGSYVGTYSPANGGTDVVTGTIDGNTIQKDADGVSDGTYNLTISAGVGNTRHWDGSDSTDWHDANNWQENLVPDACSTVELDGNIDDLATYYEPTLDVSGGTEDIANLNIGLNGSASADPTTLTLSHANEIHKLYISHDVHIGGQGILTHSRNSTTQQHTLNLSIGGDLTIDLGGRVDVAGKGIDHIESYGGYGMYGQVYGSIAQPTDVGGGGAIKIDVQGDCILNGVITAQGLNTWPTYTSKLAGGSIWLNVHNNFSGTGTLNVFGRESGAYHGGSGGRMAIYYKDYNFTGAMNAYGCRYYSAPQGSAGTIYLKDYDEPLGELIIDNNNRNFRTTPQYAGNMTPDNKTLAYKKVTVRNYGKYDANAGPTTPVTDNLNLDNHGQFIVAYNNNFIVPTLNLTNGAQLVINENKEADIVNITNSNLITSDRTGVIDSSGTLHTPSNWTMNSYTYKHNAQRASLPDLTNYVVDNAEFWMYNTGSANQYGLTIPGNVTVQNNGLLTHSANNSGQQHTLNLNIGGDFVLDAGSKIDVAGKGLHNRDVYGGYCSERSWQHVYGSIAEPNDIAGSGAIKLDIQGNCVVNGDVNAQGYYQNGAGGSIWIDARNTFSGTGTLRVNGVHYAGSGGRMAIYYKDNNFTGHMYGYGTSYHHNSAAGTIYLKDYDEPLGELIIDNNNSNSSQTTPQYADNMTEDNKTLAYKKVTVRNYGKYDANAGPTTPVTDNLNLDNHGQFIVAYNNNFIVPTLNLTNGAQLVINENKEADIVNITNSNLITSDRTGVIDSSGTLHTPSNWTMNSYTYKHNAQRASLPDLTNYVVDNAEFWMYNTGSANQYGLTIPGNVTVQNNGLLTHSANNSGQQHTLNLNIGGDFVLDAGSKIDVAGKGILKRTYGGYSRWGDTYGSITEPNDIAGGGAIKLDIQGNTTIDGLVTAKGFAPTYGNYRIAGGSILIKSRQALSGGGSLIVNGGNNTAYAPGAGGRMAIYYKDNNFMGVMQAYGGSYSGSYAGAGTIYLKDYDELLGELIIDNNGHNNAYHRPTPQYAGNMTEDNRVLNLKTLTVRNQGQFTINSDAKIDFGDTGVFTGDNTGLIINQGALVGESLVLQNGITLKDYYNNTNKSNIQNLTIENNSTMEMMGYSLVNSLDLSNLTIQSGGVLSHGENDTSQSNILNLNVDNLTIDAGGRIDLDAKGYNAGQGPGASTGNSGGGYGGVGENGDSGTGGASYGAETNPIDIGSGGSNGRGGGMLRVQANDILTINGDITAKGQDSTSSNNGGGAGGSILLIANHFNGSGSLNADGGNKNGTGGEGAGGRIAAYYQDQNFLNNGSISGSPFIDISTNKPYGGSGSAANATSRGTLYLAYPTHYQITGSGTQTAGTSQSVNVTLTDNHGNPFIWTGDRNFIFSGANKSDAGDVYPSGTYPTCSDKDNNNINFGSTTILHLINGLATPNMFLYKAETAEIETSDGTYNTFGSQNYDLDVNVSSNTPDQSQTTIDASPNPVVANNPVTITVVSRDIWGNPVTTGGDVITLNVSGANTVNPTVTDNGNGTYTATYTPTNSGQDLIVGTINGNVIQHDEDGTSDGTFHENVSGGVADHLEVTGNNAQEAGTVQTITITAKDNSGNTDFSYVGDKNIVISGANSAPDGTNPTCRDKNGTDISLGSQTNLTFSGGVATCQLYLYNKESAEIEADDGAIDSTGNVNWDLNVDVSATSIDYNESIISASPSAVVENNPTTITVTTRDQYQNLLSSGGATVVLAITGSNPETPIVTDNGDGTYTAPHTPTVVGADLITGTVDANNITHDTDGTDDGTYHLTVNAANNPPTDITLSSNTIDENEPINTVVGTLSTTDADAGDSHTYSFGCAVAGTDDGSFNINNNELRSSAVFDYETKNSYSICLRTDDGHGGVFDKNFTISVNDLDEVGPVISEVTPVPTPTNDSTPDYTFTTNEAGTITYGGDCSSGTAGATVGNNTITFNALADGVHNNCTIRVTDSSGNLSNLLAVSSFTIDTTPPNISEVTPVPTPTNDSTPDYTFTTNEAGTITYGGDCSSGTAGATVGNNTITFNALSEGLHNNCTVRVTDSLGNISSILNVSVFTIDTTPPVRSGGTPSGVLIMGTTQTAISLNTDENSTCRYSTSSGVSYGAMTNTFTTTGALAHSELITGLTNGNSYTYYVRCSDGLNVNSDDYIITFSVNNVTNNPPTDITLSNNTVDENQPVNTVIGTLSTTDADAGDTHNYSFNCGAPGADDTSFSINSNELRSNAVFDYETKNSYDICLRTDDGNGGLLDKQFMITINNLDETVVIPPTEEKIKECKTLGIKNITTNFLTIRSKVDKKYGDKKQKFKISVENLTTNDKKTLKIKSKVSNNGRVSLDIDGLEADTSYKFKVFFQGDNQDEYNYCPHSKTITTDRIIIGPQLPVLPSCGNNEMVYTTETDFPGIFCQVGNVVAEPSFPFPGEEVSWKCVNNNGEVECKASREEQGNEIKDKTRCGNGILNPGEECDDGNTIGLDGCSPTCKKESKETNLGNELTTSIMGNRGDKDRGAPLTTQTKSLIVLLLASAAVAAAQGTTAVNGLLFGLPLFKRPKKNFWGVVFDESTGQPLAKVNIVLVEQSSGKTVANTISDDRGRFGFLIAKTNEYLLKAQKRGYTLSTARRSDEVYGKLYFAPLLFEKDKIVELSIAMVKNDEYNIKKHSFVQKWIMAGTTKLLKRLFNLLYLGGMIFSAYVAWKQPNLINYLILGVYALSGALIVVNMFAKQYGSVSTKDGEKLPFSLVGLYKNNKRILFTVVNENGKYYLVAKNGYYDLEVRGKTVGGKVFNVRKKITVKRGVLKEDILVSLKDKRPLPNIGEK